MDSLLSLDSREQALTFDLMEALTSSLDLTEVLSRAYDVLSQLLAADYAAICVSRPGRPADYEWMVARMPPEYFARHDEMAHSDFVRGAVVRQPNMVLRDSETVQQREELESSVLYQRCRELGMPLEHVMAVLLDTGHDWHGGFMLYRDRLHPFSDRERALLQRLTPLLARTVRNCRVMGETRSGRWMLESLLRRRGSECLVVAPPSTELMRTDGATAVLDAWFPPSERGSHGLPLALVERLEGLTRGGLPVLPAQDTWECEGPEKNLRVTFVPLPEQGSRRLWALLLEEVPHAVPVPGVWRERLTKREVEVVARVLRGWDNQTIAEDLGCKLGTAKKHMQRIFDKLGVDNRSTLLHIASRL